LRSPFRIDLDYICRCDRTYDRTDHSARDGTPRGGLILRVAARLAYWGPAYHGYARQPDVDTVEGDLIRALRRGRAISDPRSARLAVASRTDRGVSALANVIAFDTSVPPERMCRVVHGRMHDAWLWACAPVADDFNPRHARMRRYRYHFRGDASVRGLQRAARLFQGEHDFASFTVERVGGRLRIDRIRVHRDGPFVLADFEAERFARGLIRRVAGSMDAYSRAEVTEAALHNALHGEPLRAAPAPPEGLFLLDVDCGIVWPPPSLHVAEALSQRALGATLAQRFAEQLAAELRSPSVS